MPTTIHHVQPRLDFIPPSYNPLVLKLAHGCLPILLRFRTRPWLTAGITRVEVANGEELAKLYQQFQAGQVRFIMAFRHVEVDDPLSGLYLLSRTVPQIAREQGIPLDSPIHAHFLYDRGMPLWAGDWLGWLLSSLGGVPVRRGRHPDWTSLRAARDLLINGQFPFVVAPEGATNGHGEILSPLEPGVAQLGFWCVEDLVRAQRDETVVIVPIGIQYRYEHPPWGELSRLLDTLEAQSGLPVQRPDAPLAELSTDWYYERLLRLADHFLSIMEAFYRRIRHRPLPDLPLEVPPDVNSQVAARLQRLLEVGLGVTEEFFNVSSQGTVIDRCRRLEEAGWMDIYREDLSPLHDLSPMERGLADWVAQEASLQMLHMRLAESFVAVTGSYVRDNPSCERFAETALLMFDILARLQGDKLPQRPRLGLRWVQMTVGEPISVTERWPTYHASRRAARQAIQTLTQDLQQAMESLIQRT